MSKPTPQAIVAEGGNPQASALSQRALERLVNEVPADDVCAMVKEMLTAETPQGNPDWRARTDAIKVWFSYVIGLPIQRQEIVTHKVSGHVDAAALLSNPATLDAIVRRLSGTPAGDKLKAALDKASPASIDV